VFKLTPPPGGGAPWVETVLHSFNGESGGARLEAGVTLYGEEAIYGTTFNEGPYNFGTVFKLTPPPSGSGPWTETILYAFKDGKDGAYPWGRVIFDGIGGLYGTTGVGGGLHGGNVFKLAPPPGGGVPWIETTLYSFSFPGGTGGASPESGLIHDTAGALYGVTYGGGDLAKCSGPPAGCGTVFQLK
jgi:hypothetical protein